MLLVRFRSHIGPRLMEWEHSCFLLLFGLFMMQPGPLLGSVPNEDMWGTGIFCMGVVRLASLIINGLRQRVTAPLRAISAIGSSMIFMLIAIGYVYSGRWGLAAAVFPVIAMFELFNYARAMRDAVGLSA
jgi:hypothetical protein